MIYEYLRVDHDLSEGKKNKRFAGPFIMAGLSGSRNGTFGDRNLLLLYQQRKPREPVSHVSSPIVSVLLRIAGDARAEHLQLQQREADKTYLVSGERRPGGY